MARTALLTAAQCTQVRTLYEGGARAVDLAKDFGVSESSLYKVLDGTYKARVEEPTAKQATLPTVAVRKPEGITPSLFASTAQALGQDPHPIVRELIEKAQHIDTIELDELTIAAAQLIMAKARLNRALATAH